MEQYNLIYYLLAALIGILVAFSELLSRYYSGFCEILTVGISYVYFFINGLGAIFAYWLIIHLNPGTEGVWNEPLVKSFVAGLGSMLILRSSFSNYKIGEKNLEIGLASFLKVFLNSADREYDQKRSINNLNEVKLIMKNVIFNKAAKDLPLTCLNLMQNLSYEEQTIIGNEVIKLSKSEYSDEAKSLNLGVILSKFTGTDLLKIAVTSLDLENMIISENIDLNADKGKLRELKKKFN